MKAKTRNALPKKDFGIPSKRGFPMNDAKHDRLAISGASRAEHADNISHSTEERIQHEARVKLDEKGVTRGRESPHHIQYK